MRRILPIVLALFAAGSLEPAATARASVQVDFDGSGGGFDALPLDKFDAPRIGGLTGSGDRVWVELRAKGPGERTRIATIGMSIESVEGGVVGGVADSELLGLLQDAGIEIIRTIPLSKFGPEDFPDADAAFHNYGEAEAALKGLAAADPEHITVLEIGKSHEGRAITAVRFHEPGEKEKPGIVFFGAHHAREHLSTEVPLGIASWIAENASRPEVAKLLQERDIYFVPMVNPDGIEYDIASGRYRYQRKNRRKNDDNSFGVDLNRNWPFQWKADPNENSQTWSGPGPLTEPENIALDAWMTAPERRLAGLLNYHTYGATVLHNWAHVAEFPPNVDAMEPLVQQIAADIEAVNGQAMRWGRWSVSLGYTGHGTILDYASAALGIPSITIELRPTAEDPAGFAPDPSIIAPSIAENIPAAMNFLERARASAADVTPPVLAGLAIALVSDTEATLSWTTDEPATRTVLYGTAIPFASEASPDRLQSRNHTVRIDGLSPDTEYFVQACSTNLAGLEACSPKQAFRTAALPQDIVPPAPPLLQSLRRSGGGSLEVRWTPPDEEDIAGFRLYESGDLEHWSVLRDESQLSAGATSAIVPPPLPGELRHYRMTAVDDSPNANESAPSDAYAFMLRNAATRTLVVDGYDQWNRNAVSQGRNHPFAAWHGMALAAIDEAFDTTANEEIGNAVAIFDYDNVVWVLGDEGFETETFNGHEQFHVRLFLETGGNLFVTGSQIGEDLWANGTAEDRLFLGQVLGAEYVSASAGVFEAATLPDPIFRPAPIAFDDGSRGIYRVTSPDVIAPAGGSRALLESSAGAVLGIRREGLFGDGHTVGKLVLLTFGFETIHPRERGFDAMEDVFLFFRREPAGLEFILIE